MAFSSLPSASDITSANALAADAKSLNALKYQAGENNPAALKEAAKQFESLFMRELMKSMREATMKSGMFESAQENLGTDMLDQQYAVQMSGMPGGLSDIIARQLSQRMGTAPSTVQFAAGQSAKAAAAGPAMPVSGGQKDFVQRHTDAAARVAQDSGIPASFMLGQAGHETGWGKSELRNADGSPSFNLFGIKAGAGWSGKVAAVTTTEYVDGVARKTVAKFRAYDSYEDSFRDYARLINGSPRYADARGQTSSAGAYAAALQKAGYATDPAYAAKLGRAIASAQRAQGLQA
ncbi:flagellar assembly peptidoglycan hydrolase FlgJ [Ramlibacter sp. H39-3-26]|uniref:flagellar assembly peptidoglycan hydrolase FlgJ n=1 Tax=Curvibacter soli TaxID=3031331 RepID=UPI0023D98E2B|nr:flagellar assembly peptidoglycan hydrolase FlgJ [Ramlibacter sp. H39-3-26]MDF1485808.1 flagellar assembly peptidoglycan hydrolase FlgJ [Ramlibacter sp. H39-3-26]